MFSYLKDNLSLTVSLERSDDFYSRDMVPKVDVYVEGVKIASDKAF